MTRLPTAPAARSYLSEIRTYSKAVFGGRIAKAYLDGLVAAFDKLAAAHPGIGVAEGDLGPGMRSFAHRSHRIFYRLDEDDLVIVRVSHQAQDVTSAFGSDQ